MKRFWISVVAVALIGAVGTVAAMRALGRTSERELPVMGLLPLFEMTDHAGAYFTPQRLRGKVTIANFIFTRCDTVCPAFSMKMRRLQDRTAKLGNELMLVSISVDPEHDTPAVLAEYAKRFKADSSRWLFLTGDLAVVRDTLAKGLKVAMERRGTLASGAPNIVHDEHFVLIDQELRIRGYYDSRHVERLDDLVRDAKRLAR